MYKQILKILHHYNLWKLSKIRMKAMIVLCLSMKFKLKSRRNINQALINQWMIILIRLFLDHILKVIKMLKKNNPVKNFNILIAWHSLIILLGKANILNKLKIYKFKKLNWGMLSRKGKIWMYLVRKKNNFCLF